MKNFEKLVVETAEEFPNFEIHYKQDSWLCKAINIFLKVITFWQMKKFMTHFITTIGNKVYVPDSWDERSDFDKYLVLFHERVHMRQKAKYGMIPFAICYLFLPFPIGFAGFRVLFEVEAYGAELVELMDEIPDVYVCQHFMNQVADNLTNQNYFWSWYSRQDVLHWLVREAVKAKARKG